MGYVSLYSFSSDYTLLFFLSLSFIFMASLFLAFIFSQKKMAAKFSQPLKPDRNTPLGAYFRRRILLFGFLNKFFIVISIICVVGLAALCARSIIFLLK